jgi:hypothetical protein
MLICTDDNNEEKIKKYVRGIQVAPFVPKQMKIAVDEAEEKANKEKQEFTQDDEIILQQLEDSLPEPSELTSIILSPIEFEKVRVLPF